MEDNYDSNLVDPASSHMLVSRLSHACLSINEYTVKLRTAHSNSYRLSDILDYSYMDNRSNSRANTCVTGDFTEHPVLLDIFKTIIPQGLLR